VSEVGWGHLLGICNNRVASLIPWDLGRFSWRAMAGESARDVAARSRAKDWSGHVVVERSTLRQNGRRREQVVAGCARLSTRHQRAARALRGVRGAGPLPCAGRAGQRVGPRRDDLFDADPSGDVADQPALLESDERAEVWTRLNLALNSARELPAPRRSSMPRGATAQKSASVRRRPRQGRRTNGSSGPGGLVRLVVGMAMLFGLATCGPQLASVVGDVVSDQLTATVVDDRQDPPRPPAGGKSAN
jgi:hypothetical protein